MRQQSAPMPPEAFKKKEDKEINNFVGFSHAIEPQTNVWKQGNILSLKSPAHLNGIE